MTDLAALRMRLDEVETALGVFRAEHRAQLRPLWEERDSILAELALEPTRFPKRSRMSETQRKVERCPRCRGVIQVGGGLRA